jgi:hypothetical protein
MTAENCAENEDGNNMDMHGTMNALHLVVKFSTLFSISTGSSSHG